MRLIRRTSHLAAISLSFGLVITGGTTLIDGIPRSTQLLLAAHADQPKLREQESKPMATITRIEPPELGFFSKRTEYHGIPIKAHADVDDAALIEALRRIGRMLEHNSGVLHNLVQVGAELHIIGKNQATSDLPSLRHLKGKPFDGKLTVDERARGLGGLIASCGEENLLKLPSDRYKFHRDICTHEFAHTVLAYGLDEKARSLVKRQYETAMKKGLWKTAYASSNMAEYFAETSMWYFDSRGDYGRIEPQPTEGRDWLRQYDPDAFEMLDAIYSGRRKVKPIEFAILTPHPPETEGRLRSRSSNHATQIVFHNTTKRDYRFFWLDFDGKRRPYGQIRPGAKVGQNTFATHPWLLEEASGKVLAIYVAEEKPGKVVIK